jgi:hypothetical protein
MSRTTTRGLKPVSIPLSAAAWAAGPACALLGEPKTVTWVSCGHPHAYLVDGITGRRTEGGGTFGIEGIRHAVAEVEKRPAAATAMTILQAVTGCWREWLEDDGTVVVLGPGSVTIGRPVGAGGGCDTSSRRTPEAGSPEVDEAAARLLLLESLGKVPSSGGLSRAGAPGATKPRHLRPAPRRGRSTARAHSALRGRTAADDHRDRRKTGPRSARAAARLCRDPASARTMAALSRRALNPITGRRSRRGGGECRPLSRGLLASRSVRDGD